MGVKAAEAQNAIIIIIIFTNMNVLVLIVPNVTTGLPTADSEER